MFQKLPVGDVKCKRSIHKFDEDFTENYDEDSDKGYIVAVDVEYPENLFNLHGDLPFVGLGKKIKNCNKLVCNINDKETMLFT